MLKAHPPIHLVTLGVKDLPRAKRFYMKVFGLKASRIGKGEVVFFHTGGTLLSLFPRTSLAKDAGISSRGLGFPGITLSHNVGKKGEVALVLDKARRAGGRIVKPAQDVFWGGHSGYFRDLDKHLWEVAWNPFFPFDRYGHVRLPQ